MRDCFAGFSSKYYEDTMLEEPLPGKTHRKKRKKTRVEFEEISLAELIDISTEAFHIEGSVLSTTGGYLQKKREEAEKTTPGNDSPLPPQKDTRLSPDKKTIFFSIKKFFLHHFRKRRAYGERIKPEKPG